MLFTVENTTKQLESEPNSVAEVLNSNKWKKAKKNRDSSANSKSNLVPSKV